MKILLLFVLLFNFISMPAIAYEEPVVIYNNDDFGLKHSGSEIESIAKQYAIDNALFPATQNRKFIATYNPLSEMIWLVSVSEPEGEAPASESLDYFYLYIDDQSGRVSGIYYGLSGTYKDL